MSTEKYPEHEKLKAHQAEASTLSSFIDFLAERNWMIAEYGRDKYEGDHLWPIRQRPDEIIGLFLKIDPKKLEKEKQAMLAEIRASNQHHERKGGRDA